MRAVTLLFFTAVLNLISISQLRADPVGACVSEKPRLVVFGCLTLILDHMSGKRPMNDSELYSTYYRLAVAEEGMGKLDKAIADYGNAISVDSKHVDAYVGRGILLANLTEYEDAIADFDRAIALQPRETAIYCYCARAQGGN